MFLLFVQDKFRRTSRLPLNCRLKRRQSILDFGFMKRFDNKASELANGVGHLRIDFAAAYLVDRFGQKFDDIPSVE